MSTSFQLVAFGRTVFIFVTALICVDATFLLLNYFALAVMVDTFSLLFFRQRDKTVRQQIHHDIASKGIKFRLSVGSLIALIAEAIGILMYYNESGVHVWRRVLEPASGLVGGIFAILLTASVAVLASETFEKCRQGKLGAPLPEKIDALPTVPTQKHKGPVSSPSLRQIEPWCPS